MMVLDAGRGIELEGATGDIWIWMCVVCGEEMERVGWR